MYDDFRKLIQVFRLDGRHEIARIISQSQLDGVLRHGRLLPVRNIDIEGVERQHDARRKQDFFHSFHSLNTSCRLVNPDPLSDAEKIEINLFHPCAADHFQRFPIKAQLRSVAFYQLFQFRFIPGVK